MAGAAEGAGTVGRRRLLGTPGGVATGQAKAASKSTGAATWGICTAAAGGLSPYPRPARICGTATAAQPVAITEIMICASSLRLPAATDPNMPALTLRSTVRSNRRRL
jgi:hypothetical protein